MTYKQKAKELAISRLATKELGYSVNVYHDGFWICEPLRSGMMLAFGVTWQDAIENCRHFNSYRVFA